jgi:hypothetical protein
MGQEGILLRFVEAVHLINEQNCAPVLRQVLLGKPYGTADFLTPLSTAETLIHSQPAADARSFASVVLPVPGGPHRSIE